MMYMCEVCGFEFESNEPETRKCPNCGSSSENHIPDEFNAFHIDRDSEEAF